MQSKKKSECKHSFITVTNLYGNIIQRYIQKGIVYRSLIKCEICGKKSMSTEIDKSCKIKNRPELW